MRDCTILPGDALARLREMPSTSIHACVTSPPYFGLRDYGCSGQIGLEATVDAYVANLVSIFREVRRVLHPTGTCWLNLGDSYARSAAKGQHRPGDSGKQAYVYDRGGGRASASADLSASGLKEKDLIGVPWRVALALQADGWYLRSDVIWAKANAMPESVTDRPTCSHEYLFLLAKNARYYYDGEAVKEPAVSTHGSGNGYRRPEQLSRGGRGTTKPWQSTAFKNRRSVWRLNAKPFPGAHFATYPPELVTPCIMASTSEYGVCAHCLSPYTRVTQKGEPDAEWQRACGADRQGEYHGTATKAYRSAGAQDASATKARILAGMVAKRTIGWRKSCACPGSDVGPATVLDPFAGSGTTLAVALAYGRAAVGIELNPEYLPLIRKRLAGVQPRLLEADSFRGGEHGREAPVCAGSPPVQGNQQTDEGAV